MAWSGVQLRYRLPRACVQPSEPHLRYILVVIRPFPSYQAFSSEKNGNSHNSPFHLPLSRALLIQLHLRLRSKKPAQIDGPVAGSSECRFRYKAYRGKVIFVVPSEEMRPFTRCRCAPGKRPKRPCFSGVAGASGGSLRLGHGLVFKPITACYQNVPLNSEIDGSIHLLSYPTSTDNGYLRLFDLDPLGRYWTLKYSRLDFSPGY